MKKPTFEQVIVELYALADEAEQISHDQIKRSANFNGPGYTQFSNAVDWGQRARFYREAAADLRSKFFDDGKRRWARVGN